MRMTAARRQQVSPWTLGLLLYFTLQLPAILNHPEFLPWITLNLGLALIASWIAVTTHELGHALVARALGLRLHQVVIGQGTAWFRFALAGCQFELRTFPMGGVTRVTPETLRWGRTRLCLVSAAGPAASWLLAVWTLGPSLRLWHAGVSWRLINSVFWDGFGFRFHHGPAFRGLLAVCAGLGVLNLVPFVGRRNGRAVWSDGLKVLALPFVSARSLARSVAAHHEQVAHEALQAGNFEAALAEEDEAIRQAPDESLLQLPRSTALIGLRRFSEARTALLPLLADERIAPKARAIAANNVAWAIVEGDLPHLEDAGALSERAMEAAGEEASVQNTRGCVLVLMGRAAEGMPLLERTIGASRSGRDRANVASVMALAERMLGHDEAAEGWWTEAERADPGSPLLARTKMLARSLRSATQPG